MNEKELRVIKDLENYTKILRNYLGFILSYGTGEDLIPMGTYALSKVAYQGGNINDTNNFVAYFNKVEITDDYDMSLEKSSTISMPLKIFLDIFESSIGSENSSIMRDLTGEDSSIELIAYLDKIYEENIAENESLIQNGNFNAYNISLEDIGAKYFNNGNEMGTNYSVAPYNLGRTLRKVKTR